MAIAFVKKDPNTTLPAQASNAVSLTVTFDTDTTTGNFIGCLACGWRSAAFPTFTFGDNKGNGYANAKYVNHGTDFMVGYIGFVGNATGGSNHQVTATADAGATEIGFGAIEVSGVGTAVSGTPASATGSGTAVASGTTTPTGNALYLGIAVKTGGTSPTWSIAPWTGGVEIHNQPDPAVDPMASGYEIASGAQGASWTLSTGIAWAACVAAFDEGSPPPDPYGTPRDHSGVKPWSSIWRPARA